MKLSIEDITKFIKERYRYFLELLQDIKSLQEGKMDPDEGQELIEYLSKVTKHKVPAKHVERLCYLDEIKSQCEFNINGYMELLKFLRHPNKDIGLMGLYISLQSKLELSQMKTVEVIPFDDAEQLKMIRNALLRHLPLSYQFLQQGIKYKRDKKTGSINTKLNMQHHIPEFNEFKGKLDALSCDPRILSLPRSILQSLLQPLVDQKELLLSSAKGLDQAQGQSKDTAQYTIDQLTGMLAGYNSLVSMRGVVSNLARELQNAEAKSQLEKALPRVLQEVQEKITEMLDRISDAILALDNSHKKLAIENYAAIREAIERLCEEYQVIREKSNDDVLGADSMDKLSAIKSKFDHDIHKLNESLVTIEQLIASHQSQIEKLKAEKQALYAQQKQLQAKAAEETDLKRLEEFREAQAEKISKRKADLLALQAAKKAEKRSIFSSEPSPTVVSSPITGVNADMMARLMTMRDEHIDLILSILKLQGKIFYSDVENLIINQLDGDIIGRGGSHRTITLGVLFTEMYINKEQQQLPVTETVTGGVARPHKPGHSEVPMSKLNTKLVRQTFIAAGITLDAMEEIIARRDYAQETAQGEGLLSMGAQDLTI